MILVLGVLLLIVLIGIASAIEGCCEKKLNDGWCVMADSSNCDPDPNYHFSPSICENTDYCESGVCYHERTGICSPNSHEATCKAQNGEWSKLDSFGRCKIGCCFLATNTKPTTEKQCEFLSEQLGMRLDFDDSIPENECRFYSYEKGACILFNSGCKFTTEKDCLEELNGIKFEQDMFCSDKDLEEAWGYNYTAENYTNCVAGEEDIYYFDDHNNQEGVAIDCEPNGQAACALDEQGEPYCKNLNCEEGQAAEEFYAIHNRYPINNESWCVYDAYVGDGKDVAGSKHWQRYCERGKIKSIACGGDYRREICAEKIQGATVGPPTNVIDSAENEGNLFCPANFEICGAQNNPYTNDVLDKIWCCPTKRTVDYTNKKIIDSAENEGNLFCPSGFEICGAQNNPYTNDKFDKIWCCPKNDIDKEAISTAQCRPNLGGLCFGVDSEAKCKDLDDCKWQVVNIDAQFIFGACVPKFPIGFNFSSSNKTLNGEDVCKLATTKCIMQYTKPFVGSWHCINNCKCQNVEFIRQMNELCISLGDCGAYINFVGNGTDSYKVTGETDLVWKYVCDGVDICNYYGNNLGLLIIKTICLDKGTCVGADDPRVVKGRRTEDIQQNKKYFILNGEEDIIWEAYLDYLDPDKKPNIVGVNTPKWLTIIREVGSWIGKLKKVGTIKHSYLTGGGKKAKSVTFECLPWKPPYGGEDCDKCNGDPLKPCSEYRCQSLGTACKLIKLPYYEENPECYNTHADDFDPPIITFDKVELGYKDSSTSNGASIKTYPDNKCVYNYSQITLSVKTNEAAECRWSLGPENTFELMPPGSFDEGNQWALTHVITDANIYDTDGMFEMYIKCIDIAGNWGDNFVIDFCLRAQPDWREPTITSVEPESGSYLKLGETEKEIIIYIDKPAQCRYEVYPNTLYEAMSGEMLCNNEYEEGDEYVPEWFCVTTLTGLTESINRVYFKCNDSSGNIMPNDYPYRLLETREELIIRSISPENGEIIETKKINDYNPFILRVETEGGAKNNGESNCTWETWFGQTFSWDHFYEKLSAHHTYNFTTIGNGTFAFNITCEDIAGNTAKDSTQFTIAVDKEPPRLENTSIEDDIFKFFTDEDAACFYRASENREDENCLFDLDANDEGTEDITVGDFWNQHTITEFSKRKYYYVRCVDEWENEGCVLIIEPTDINNREPPKIIRVRHSTDTNQLVIITNKDALCYYKTDGCGFSVNALGSEGIKLTCNDDYCEIHSVAWNPDIIYNIKCIDSWGNSNSGCAMTVRPSEFI